MVRALILIAFLGGVGAASAEVPGKSLTLIVEPRFVPAVVGEMIPVTIRGVYDTEIALEEMEIAPSPSFDWVQLEQDSWRNERIGGVTRRVVERKLAIFPKTSGLDTFGPVDHVLTVIGANSQREELTVHAQPAAISVGPMPDDPPFEKPWGWRFTASRLTITDELSTDPAQLSDGEIVTRTVTLRADGALPEMLPPRPVIQEPWLITFADPIQKSFERDANGVTSTVIWTWRFRPATGEPGVVPPVPIPFFNTTTRKVEAVEIPPLPVAYASFEASQVPGGEMRRGARLAYLGALGMGLLAGVAISALGVEGRTGWFGRARRFYSPIPLLRLRRAARAGDLLSLRRAGEDYLAPGEARSPARRAEALARLETAIYGPGTSGLDTGGLDSGGLDSGGFDARAFVRDLRRAWRG